MRTQEQQKHEWCLDGRCPPGIDEVQDIVLTPLEKKAIFYSFLRKIELLKESLLVR